MKLIDLYNQCESIRQTLEWWIDNESDLMDYFVERGGIYGEDNEGNLIVGYGVCGSANIVIKDDCVEFGSVKSKPFSSQLIAQIKKVKNELKNC